MNDASEDILKRIFEHLTIQELIAGPLLVSRKWHHAVLFGNHRCITPSVFQLLSTSTTTADTPLRRCFFLKHNLLKDCSNKGSQWEGKAATCKVSKERGQMLLSKQRVHF